MKDVTGKKVKVGDRVYFPVRVSSSCFLAEGAVTGFKLRTAIIRSFATGALNYRFSMDIMKVPEGVKTIQLTDPLKRYLGR